MPRTTSSIVKHLVSSISTFFRKVLIFIDFGIHFGIIFASFWYHFSILFRHWFLDAFLDDIFWFLIPKMLKNGIVFQAVGCLLDDLVLEVLAGTPRKRTWYHFDTIIMHLYWIINKLLMELWIILGPPVSILSSRSPPDSTNYRIKNAPTNVLIHWCVLLFSDDFKRTCK